MPESYKEDGRPAQQWYWDDWFSAFDVRLCSVGARGVWIDMLGIMYKAEIRGTLTINGRQINSKTLAKIVGDTMANINKYLKELEDQDVFSRLEDNTVICRRMFRESGRKDQISKIRSIAGKKGADIRWQPDSKEMAKLATSSSTSSSSPPSTSISNHRDTKVSLPHTKKTNNPKIEFSFEERKWLNITIEDKAGWKDAYPAVDIDQELRKMREWLIANPSKKKTNYRKFINNWLSKTQDQGGSQKFKRAPEGRPMTRKEERKQSIKDWVKKPMKEGINAKESTE